MKNQRLHLLPCLILACGCHAPSLPKPGEPLADLTPAQLAQFRAGKAVFQREFVPENGLGPLFNSVSCAECHEKPALGGAGDEIEVHATRFTSPRSCDSLFQQGGPVIQQKATPLLQAKGIQQEQVPAAATGQARRSSPALFGFGLIDAIPDATILAHEDPTDANHDGIRGHANRTVDGRVGRFGRKAAVATLFEFIVGAFPQEMGVTTPQSPLEETVNGTPVPPDTDPAPDPEITMDDLEKVDAFTRFLALPPPVDGDYYDHERIRRGKELFTSLKCAVCHVPEMTTGTNAVKALDRKPVKLYSDLLLHDMGPGLADICMEQAKPWEFRTEILMGLRLRDHFLHDGSARTVREAIERHDGEAQFSRDKFNVLSEDDQAALLKFLETI